MSKKEVPKKKTVKRPLTSSEHQKWFAGADEDTKKLGNRFLFHRYELDLEKNLKKS